MDPHRNSDVESDTPILLESSSGGSKMEDAAHRERLERARLKNLEYMRKLDEQEAAREADALLASVAKQFGQEYAIGEKSYEDIAHATTTAAARGVKRTTAQSGLPKNNNSTVYITGLTTYIACRQLEGMCSKIGKVRRIKFYKDDRGGLKLNHFEIKPGVLITAVPAQFTAKPASTTTIVEDQKQDGDATTSQREPERLFIPEDQDAPSPPASSSKPHALLTAEAVPTTASDPARLELPSKSIILKQVWDPLELQEMTTFFDELEDDMRSECSKFGVVDHVHIVADGSVLVRFHALEAAIKCLQVMNGRWFDGRRIDARFDQSAPEEPDDADTKLEAFLATIG